jgi:hypothetical protein
MYGLILQNVAEYIQVKHGMDKWIMVKEHLNLDWVCTMYSLQRINTKNWKQIFPEKELRGHSHNFHIHVSVSDLYIPTIDLPVRQQKISGSILVIYKSFADT